MEGSFFIVSTGSELTTGRSTDTNGPFLSRSLADAGFSVAGLAVLPDDPERLLGGLERFLSLPDTVGVIMTGGLGPTMDDHTVDMLAKLTGRGVVEEPEALRRLSVLVNRRPGRLSMESARRQVRTLEGATVLKNERGLAPGMLVERGDKVIAAMPGVPREMEPMFADRLLPELLRLFAPNGKARRTFYVYGLGESQFESRFVKLAGFSEKPSDFDWGVSAGEGRIHVFLESEREEFVANLHGQARGEFGDRFLERTVESELHDLCLDRGITLGAAESCTGGLIGRILTDRPGSSGYFTGSLVTYSNEAKMNVLGVEEGLLARHGAVSEECARAMARGALSALKADWAVSVTGVAGPDGGSEEKPVGTVFVAGAGAKGEAFCERLFMPLDRDRIRSYAANMALFLLFLRISRDE